jgi:signal recognition particle receptor subunit alpha
MLDAFEIFTTSGVVLWSRSASTVGATAVNNLINDVFIEERVRPVSHASSNPTYKYDKYTLKYTLVKDLGLIFVVCPIRQAERPRSDRKRRPSISHSWA